VGVSKPDRSTFSTFRLVHAEPYRRDTAMSETVKTTRGPDVSVEGDWDAIYVDGEWQRVQTELTQRTEAQFEFRADSPGLSVFAVVLENPDTGEAAGAEVTPGNEPAAGTEPPADEPSGPSGFGIAIALGIAAILVVAALAIRARFGGR